MVQEVRDHSEVGLIAGVDLGRFGEEGRRRLLVSVTEQRSREEIERWVETLRDAGGGKAR